MPTLYALQAEKDVRRPYTPDWSWPTEHVLEIVDVTPNTMSLQAVVPLGQRRAFSFAVSPTHQRVFLPDTLANEVVVFDTAGGVIGAVGGMPMAFDCVLSRDQGTLFVSTSDGIYAIDTATLATAGPFGAPAPGPGPNHPQVPWSNAALALTADGATLLSHDPHRMVLSLFDPGSHALLQTVSTQLSPNGWNWIGSIAHAPDSNGVALFFVGGYVAGVDLTTSTVSPLIGRPLLGHHSWNAPNLWVLPSRIAHSELAARSYVGGYTNDAEPRLFEVELGVGDTEAAGVLGGAFALTTDQSRRWLYAAQREPANRDADILALYDTVAKTLDATAYTFSRRDLTTFAMRVVGSNSLPLPDDPGRFEAREWEMVITILAGVAQGGGGVVITPGGVIVPVDPAPIHKDRTPILRAIRALKIAQAAEEHPVPEVRRRIQKQAVEQAMQALREAGIQVRLEADRRPTK